MTSQSVYETAQTLHHASMYYTDAEHNYEQFLEGIVSASEKTAFEIMYKKIQEYITITQTHLQQNRQELSLARYICKTNNLISLFVNHLNDTYEQLSADERRAWGAIPIIDLEDMQEDIAEPIQVFKAKYLDPHTELFQSSLHVIGAIEDHQQIPSISPRRHSDFDVHTSSYGLETIIETEEPEETPSLPRRYTN